MLAYSISIAFPYIKLEVVTEKFLIWHKLLAVDIRRIDEVSVIAPVLLFPITEKSWIITFIADPMVYRSSSTLLIRVSFVIVMLL